MIDGDKKLKDIIHKLDFTEDFFLKLFPSHKRHYHGPSNSLLFKLFLFVSSYHINDALSWLIQYPAWNSNLSPPLGVYKAHQQSPEHAEQACFIAISNCVENALVEKYFRGNVGEIQRGAPTCWRNLYWYSGYWKYSW